MNPYKTNRGKDEPYIIEQMTHLKVYTWGWLNLINKTNSQIKFGNVQTSLKIHRQIKGMMSYFYSELLDKIVNTFN